MPLTGGLPARGAVGGGPHGAAGRCGQAGRGLHHHPAADRRRTVLCHVWDDFCFW